AMMRVLPASTMSTPNGAPAQPTSIWPLITWVRVAGAAPVGVGLNFTPEDFCSASTAVWVDEPLVEYATVLPSVSLRLLIGEAAGTYQNSWLPPVKVEPITRSGAPLANAPSAPRNPVATPIWALSGITTCWVSPPPWV